ncbi:hypothetical protein G6F42_004620 [Rhizopus arrhizus]|nr:hypothetical protein G6F42_004620 [Rhizopus arrhizus]
MSAALDYYQVLQIEKDASDQQIKKAYRKLALKFHPDKNSSADAVEKFKDISEAYEILSDPEKRRVYDSRGSDPMHDGDYDYHNPFAGFAFHSPEEIFAEFFNHMSGFGRGGDMFSSFMMPPMHQAPPPPPPFGGFNHPFMMGGFGDTGGFFGHDFMSPLMGSSPFQQQSFIASSQNSSRGLNGGGYSKSVSTTTRNVNGVVESVKVTKITDSNGTKVIEEYGNGLTKINGVEQPKQQHQIEPKASSPSYNNRSVEKIQIISDSEGEEDEQEQGELDEYDQHRDYFYRQEQIRQQQLKLQQEQQRLWEEQRQHDEYMRQQRERMHQQRMMLHQQQMMQHMHSPFPFQQHQQQHQQPYNRHQQDNLFDSVYGHYPQYNHFL